MNLDLGLKDSHVVITGGCGSIGQTIVEAFVAAQCSITILDIKAPRSQSSNDAVSYIQVDITNEKELEKAFDQATAKFGTATICIAAAGLDLSFIPHHHSICDLPLEQWEQTIRVNTTGTFLTARAWLRRIRAYVLRNTDEKQKFDLRNVSLVIIGSEAGVFGVPGNADYATSKAAIQYGLTRSLAPEAARTVSGARVNAIAPGPVETEQFQLECRQDTESRYRESEATVALRKSVPKDAVARTCIMLASDNFSSHMTGQTISVDSGKSGRLFWGSDGQPLW